VKFTASEIWLIVTALQYYLDRNPPNREELESYRRIMTLLKQ